MSSYLYTSHGAHRAPHHPSAKRAYERLRKRSWRRWTFDGYRSIEDVPYWSRAIHEAYLQGVREGLEAGLRGGK